MMTSWANGLDGSGAGTALPWLYPTLSLCQADAGHDSDAAGALGSLCMKAHHEMKDPTKGFLFPFYFPEALFLVPCCF